MRHGGPFDIVMPMLNHLYKPVPHQQLNDFIHSPFTLLSTASRQFCSLSISLAAARTASTPKLQVAMQAIGTRGRYSGPRAGHYF